MYFVLYDKNFNSIGETYNLESWSRIERSHDFDEMKIVGEKIPSYSEPFLVVVKDHKGKLKFSGLASTPSTDDKLNKTSIMLKDYTTLWNTEILIDWGQLMESESDDFILTLEEYLDFILACWLRQTDIGLKKVEWDTSKLYDIEWDEENLNVNDKTGIESLFLYDHISKVLSYYNIYCIPELDLYDETLTFIFYPIDTSSSISIRLQDFGVPEIEKSFGEFNRVTIYNHVYEQIQTWGITENNQVVKLPTEKNLIYPAKNKNFIAEEPSEELSENQSLWNAVYEAVMELSLNRYQINIDLDFQQYSSIIEASTLNFSRLVSVYTEEGLYRELPVGEVETNSSGKHIVRLGYRIQELTQEI